MQPKVKEVLQDIWMVESGDKNITIFNKHELFRKKIMNNYELFIIIQPSTGSTFGQPTD